MSRLMKDLSPGTYVVNPDTPRGLSRKVSGRWPFICPGRLLARQRAPSAHAEEVHHEDERLVGPDDAACAALAVRQVRGDRDAPAPADAHPAHALVPAGDHLALAEAELERAAAIPGGIELPAVLVGHADVMDLDDLARDGLVAVADRDVLELELVGGRLVGRDGDLGLLGGSHVAQRYRSRGR